MNYVSGKEEQPKIIKTKLYFAIGNEVLFMLPHNYMKFFFNNSAQILIGIASGFNNFITTKKNILIGVEKIEKIK